MLTIDLFEELEGPPEPTLIDALRDFLPLAIKHLELKKLPKIKLLDEIETEHMPSFGKFSNDDRTVHLGIKNRHPNDVLRTLAHELTHYAQGEYGKLDADSGATGSPEEDQANAEAGVIMREFNQQFPQYMELKPIMLEKWSQKYKKSINCSNPKGFSQKAHCAGRKKNTKESVAEGGAETSWADGTEKITLQDILELTKHVKQINLPINDNLKSKLIHWDGNPEEIERINQVTISNQFPILIIVDEQGQIEFILDGNHRLHKAIQSQAKTIPAKLIKPSDLSDKAKSIFHIKEQDVAENFADGKGPGRPGDSQRHGIPKGATMAQLEKAAKASGRKGQLARWQINMRRGKKK
jgi:Zn-dependent peptidase ImmA (M78 family)